MQILVRWLVLLLAGVLSGSAATSLENARRAQALLGPDTWSEIIRVQNCSMRSPYPAIVHALVFEEGGLLWFYSDRDGTQSLSLYRNRLAWEKEHVGTLLQDIEAGFTQFVVVPREAVAPPLTRSDPLPNGCFIESVAALRERVVRGEEVEDARLLSCYVRTRRGLRGHTVLTYETPQGFYLVDPAAPSEPPRSVPRSWKDDPMTLAALAVHGATVTRARWVPVDFPRTVHMAGGGDVPENLSTETPIPRLMQ